MKKRQTKGFTLVEVIVALAVFSIMALMLCMMYALTAKMSYETHVMNQKIDEQATQGEERSYTPPAAVTPQAADLQFTYKDIADTYYGIVHSVAVVEIQPAEDTSEENSPNIKFIKN